METKVACHLSHVLASNIARRITIKRLLRKRENIDTVLAEIKQLFEQFHHQQIGLITARTDHWYEGELTHFLERH